MKKGVLKIMLGSIILEAILVCLFILIGKLSLVSWYSISSVGVIFLYSLLCLMCSRVYDDYEYRNVAILGAVFASLTALLIILEIWHVIGYSTFILKLVSTTNSIAIALSFSSWILSYASVNDIMEKFKKATIILISILSTVFIALTWFGNNLGGFFLRLYYVLIVLTVVSFVCTLILTRVYKKELLEFDYVEKIDDIKTVNNYTSQTGTNIDSVHSQDNNNNNLL